MKRREFGRTLVRSLAGAGVTGSASSSAISAKAARVPRKNALMHVGGDYHSVAGGPGADITGEENLEYNLRHGVKHLTATVRGMSDKGAWDLDELKRMKDNCDQYGVVFEAIRMDHEYIRLRKGPKRDRRLDNIIGNIQKAAQVGVKIITSPLEGDPHPAKPASAGDAAELRTRVSNWKTIGRICPWETWAT